MRLHTRPRFSAPVSRGWQRWLCCITTMVAFLWVVDAVSYGQGRKQRAGSSADADNSPALGARLEQEVAAAHRANTFQLGMSQYLYKLSERLFPPEKTKVDEGKTAAARVKFQDAAFELVLKPSAADFREGLLGRVKGYFDEEMEWRAERSGENEGEDAIACSSEESEQEDGGAGSELEQFLFEIQDTHLDFVGAMERGGADEDAEEVRPRLAALRVALCRMVREDVFADLLGVVPQGDDQQAGTPEEEDDAAPSRFLAGLKALGVGAVREVLLAALAVQLWNVGEVVTTPARDNALPSEDSKTMLAQLSQELPKRALDGAVEAWIPVAILGFFLELPVLALVPLEVWATGVNANAVMRWGPAFGRRVLPKYIAGPLTFVVHSYFFVAPALTFFGKDANASANAFTATALLPMLPTLYLFLPRRLQNGAAVLAFMYLMKQWELPVSLSSTGAALRVGTALLRVLQPAFRAMARRPVDAEDMVAASEGDEASEDLPPRNRGEETQMRLRKALRKFDRALCFPSASRGSTRMEEDSEEGEDTDSDSDAGEEDDQASEEEDPPRSGASLLKRPIRRVGSAVRGALTETGAEISKGARELGGGPVNRAVDWYRASIVFTPLLVSLHEAATGGDGDLVAEVGTLPARLVFPLLRMFVAYVLLTRELSTSIPVRFLQDLARLIGTLLHLVFRVVAARRTALFVATAAVFLGVVMSDGGSGGNGMESMVTTTTRGRERFRAPAEGSLATRLAQELASECPLRNEGEIGDLGLERLTAALNAYSAAAGAYSPYFVDEASLSCLFNEKLKLRGTCPPPAREREASFTAAQSTFVDTLHGEDMDVDGMLQRIFAAGASADGAGSASCSVAAAAVLAEVRRNVEAVENGISGRRAAITGLQNKRSALMRFLQSPTNARREMESVQRSLADALTQQLDAARRVNEMDTALRTGLRDGFARAAQRREKQQANEERLEKLLGWLRSDLAAVGRAVEKKSFYLVQHDLAWLRSVPAQVDHAVATATHLFGGLSQLREQSARLEAGLGQALRQLQASASEAATST
mmetsp:Transcript_25722/g.64819  ORF Transcript_25722/g.64819 Transcript_25722/m.64819 type:complete len:1049 (+) Transcript_25722:423-3569(+)